MAAHPENESLFPGGPTVTPATPVTTLVIQAANRQRVLTYLEATGSPAVRELLGARSLTNTVLFPASASASGQAFDAAVSVCGLLLAGDHLTPGLRDTVLERLPAPPKLAMPNRWRRNSHGPHVAGPHASPWGQLTVFVSHIKMIRPRSLNWPIKHRQMPRRQLPELFAAVVLSQHPDQVASVPE